MAKTSKTEFAVTYKGAALDDGNMAVRDLAPALLALGDLFTEASTILHPDRPPVALQIKATNEGSFEVLLMLTAEGMWDQVVNIFSSDEVTALVNLKEAIVGGGVVGFGVLKLISKLTGRKVEHQEQLPNGAVRLDLDDETSLEVPPEELRLYRSMNVRKRSREIVEPLRRNGIDALQFTSEKEVTVTIGSAEVDAFEVPEAEEVTLTDRETEMHVSITSLVFTEGNKWKFSDGDNTFFAAIEDKTFVDRVQRGQESFRKNDILRCNVKIEQRRVADGLRTTYTIIDVLEHIPSAVQLPLPGEADQRSA